MVLFGQYFLYARSFAHEQNCLMWLITQLVTKLEENVLGWLEEYLTDPQSWGKSISERQGEAQICK